MPSSFAAIPTRHRYAMNVVVHVQDWLERHVGVPEGECPTCFVTFGAHGTIEIKIGDVGLWCSETDADYYSQDDFDDVNGEEDMFFHKWVGHCKAAWHDYVRNLMFFHDVEILA